MPDTTSVTATIAAMITAGASEREVLAAAALMFPELTPAELSAALQDAQAAAERQANRRR
jgi:uncharacterized protein (DUF433 family)